MFRRKIATGVPIPKCLAVGALADGGRFLFLIKREPSGIERLELPCILVPSGRSEFAEIKNEFARQTGIDAQVHEVISQSRYNCGSRKRKIYVPVLVFKVTARERFAKPSSEFSGFAWLSLENAKKQKLGRQCEWLRR